MRAHLRRVDWRSIVIDLITATAATGAGFAIWGTGFPAQVVSAGLLGYAFLLATYAVWEIAHPEAKARAAEIKRYDDENRRLHSELTRVNDEFDQLAEERDELHEEIRGHIDEHAYLSSEVDRLEQKTEELESQLSEYVAA